MRKDEHINHWMESAENDFNAALNLINSKNFDWALFLGHLTIEKIFKALFIQNNDSYVPPKTHNLIFLAKLAKIEINEEISKILFIINKFNIQARYPDYKNEFYKQCTEDFTLNQFEIITRIYKWLKSLLK